MFKLVSLLVLLVLTVLGARACNSSGSGGDLNPSKVVGNGLAGLCANQSAVDEAGGQSDSGAANSGTVLSPSAQSQLNSALGMAGEGGSTPLSCTTTTNP